MPTAPVRALFSEGEDENVDDDDDAATTRKRNDEKKSHSSSSSSLAAFLLESLRRKPEISIPVAFDKQKSGNSLIGPSALWWRDAFAISSSLLREEEEEGEEEDENVGKLLIYENDEAAMAEGRALARRAQQAGKYTDTASFTIRCLVCQRGLTGEKEAVEHAKATGHTNFSEFK